MEAKLIIVSPSEQPGEYALDLPVVVGRGRDATLKLLHPQVSRRHCEIREADQKLVVRDLGSLNGTYIGQQRVEDETPLPSGELLTIGAVTFRAVYEEQAGWMPEGTEGLVGGTAAAAIVSGAMAPDDVAIDSAAEDMPGFSEEGTATAEVPAEEMSMDWLQPDAGAESPVATDTFGTAGEETVSLEAVQSDLDDEPLDMSLEDFGGDDSAPAPAEAELAPLELSDDEASFSLEPPDATAATEEPLELEAAEDDILELSPEDDLNMVDEAPAADPAVGLDFPKTDEFAAETSKPEAATATGGGEAEGGDWSFLEDDAPKSPAEKEDDEDLDNFFKSLQ